MKKWIDSMFGKQNRKSERIPREESVFNTTTTSEPKIDIKATSSRLVPVNRAPKEEEIYDTFCFVILCQTHKKVAIGVTQHNTGRALWLPFVYVSATTSWTESVRDGVAMILSGNDDKKLSDNLKATQPFDSYFFETFRLQLPQKLTVISRITCLIVLKKANISPKLCPEHKKAEYIEWFDLDQIIGGQIEFWGPEVVLNCKKLSEWKKEPEIEGNYFETIEYFTEDIFTYVARDPPKNLEEDMLKVLQITEQEVDRVFNDFSEHCFPAFFMTKYSFKDYLNKYCIEGTDRQITNLFNAFNYKTNGYLSFHELLLGLAAIDPDSPHLETRFKFVFRYYDSDSNGFLNENEFRSLIRDINREDPNVSDETIDQKMKESWKLMKAKPNKGVVYEEFRNAIGSRQFRGTSTLCRSKIKIFSTISKKMIEKCGKTRPEIKKSMTEYVSKKIYSGICENCKKQNYDIAIHSVTIDRKGQFVSAQEIKEIKGQKQSSQSTKNKYLSEKYSIEVTFNPQSVANVFVEKIRAFNAVKGTKDKPRGLFDESAAQKELMYKMVDALCKEITPIIETEDRCLKISSPIVVIGDIHGNLEDLFSIENGLFKSVPVICNNFLFLGDYVDRGKWSMECVLYIMSLKVLLPNHFFLLRGNHEMRQLQDMYGFHSECKLKYGDKYGEQIWETLNRVFDRLPLAAVVDDTVFCCHGGIPSTGGTIAEIDKIKVNLKQPETESPTAWELVWNDPANDDIFRDAAQLERLDNRNPLVSRGFIYNPRRGTAHFFNNLAAHQFLKNNGLTHIIRAHEVPMYGFGFWFDFKLVTVFSHSHYSGVDNSAAVVHLCDQLYRIFVIDTTNNAPATDPPKHRHKH